MPHTSTFALTNVSLPYAVQLANKDWAAACAGNPSLALGVNTVAGHLINAAVGEATGIAATPLTEVLAA